MPLHPSQHHFSRPQIKQAFTLSPSKAAFPVKPVGSLARGQGLCKVLGAFRGYDPGVMMLYWQTYSPATFRSRDIFQCT